MRLFKYEAINYCRTLGRKRNNSSDMEKGIEKFMEVQAFQRSVRETDKRKVRGS